MNSKLLNFVMIGLIALAVLALFGGAYETNQLFVQKSKKLTDLNSQSQVLSDQQTGLTKEKKEVKQYASLEQTAKTIVPQDKNQAEAVLEITKIASDSGISQLSSITFPASTLGGVRSGVAATTSTTPSPSTSTSSSAQSGLTQLTPVKGMPGVYELQITISQGSDNPIPYTQFLTFLSKLEQNRRTAQVSSITLNPDSKNRNQVAFTLIINEFIKP